MMKHRRVAICSCVLALAGIAGCGSEGSDDSVPNVVGARAAVAKADLEEAGFEVRITGRPGIEYTSPDEYDMFENADCQFEPYVVVEQSPDAGLDADPGSTVTIDLDQDC